MVVQSIHEMVESPVKTLLSHSQIAEGLVHLVASKDVITVGSGLAVELRNVSMQFKMTKEGG